MIAASGAVKHEEVVEQVKKLFTKLSTDPTTATQLVAKEPAIFTGSEVGKYVFYCLLQYFFALKFWLVKSFYFVFSLKSG